MRAFILSRTNIDQLVRYYYYCYYCYCYCYCYCYYYLCGSIYQVECNHV